MSITLNKQDWAILPYNVKKIRDRYLISTHWGNWISLDREEFKKLHSLNLTPESGLFKRLKSSNLIVNNRNIDKLTDHYRGLHSGLFYDTGLHIAVVTDRCNFACSYCQTNKAGKKMDMDLHVATKVLGCLFSVSNPNVRLEFQGGEPLLNWDTVKFLCMHARKQNRMEKKNLAISLVSNLALLDDEKLKFLVKHDVEFCTSLDGPKDIHDQNRQFKNGSPTHGTITGKIDSIKKEYKKRKLNKRIGALPTVTKQALENPKDLIDEYVRLGFDSIHLRELSRFGQAAKNWEKIGYTPDEFNQFWKSAFDYILELNKTGTNIREELSVFILKKILRKSDPLYVDLDSPCGAARSQLAYAPNGDVYTCDEARMLGSDTFKLGNVLHNSYQDLMKSENLFYTSQASLLNLWDYNSAFSCWSGTCPVMNFHHQSNPVAKISLSDRHKILNFKFNYLFEKILFDSKALKIFNDWLNKDIRRAYEKKKKEKPVY